jgi:hypothetical protein
MLAQLGYSKQGTEAANAALALSQDHFTKLLAACDLAPEGQYKKVPLR